MESQLKHPQQHTNLEHEHGEKQTVLKKVKAKARKIKDSIKKHGHHHGHDEQQHENCPEFYHEEDDDDHDEYEDMEKDPEVHGAPIYESQVARNPKVGLGGNQGLMHHKERHSEPEVVKDHTTFGVPAMMPHQPNSERTDEPAVGKDHTIFGVPAMMPHQPNYVRTDEPVPGKDHTKVGVPAGHELMHHQPNLERIDEPAVGKDRTSLGVPTSHQPYLERTDEHAVGKDHTRLGIPTSHGLMHHQPNLERTDEHAVGKDHTGLVVPTSHGLMHHQPDLERTDEHAVGKDHTGLVVPTSQGLMHRQPNLERTDEPAVGKDHTMPGVPTGHGMMHHQPGLEGTDEPAVGKEHTRLGVPTSHEPEWIAPELQKIPKMSLNEDLGALKHTLEEGHRLGKNSRAKVSGPAGAGAEETPGISPLLCSLDKMSVYKPAAATGSHDQVESLGKMPVDKLATESHDQLASERPTKYRDIPDDSPLITGEAAEQDLGLQGGGYGEKLAYATAALADKVVEAKDAVAARLGYGDEKIGGADDQSDRTSKTSYTEKALQGASLLADKTVEVKDAVAAKLGYGGTEDHRTPREPVDHEALMQQQQSGYMERVSDFASALADKAAEAKNVVALKLGYDQTGDDAVSAMNTRPDQTGGSPTETSTWADKLKPGDEDKALSELISDSVFKRSPQQDVISDQQGEMKSMSKVTESEAVARRFGTKEEEKMGDLTHMPGSESPRKAAVDKIKVAVTSLWSPGDETHPQLEASQTSNQHEADQSTTGVRRLQESAN